MSATKEERIRQEFNRWAEAGRGEGMIEGHSDVAEQMIEAMDIQPSDRVLDLGCGIGWATRSIAAHLSDGSAVGADISDEMIARAQANPENPKNVSFSVASAASLPFGDSYFDKVFSVESLYYYPDIPGALKEVNRVMKTGGLAFVMVNLFWENEGSRHWVEKLAIPAQLLSEAEYRKHFEDAGFSGVRTERFHDRRPMEELLKPNSFDSLEMVKKGLEAGSLVVVAEK
ncbi:MAG TPA: class I SAM-dependent methyltransferase [Blastocatellia bacterium]|nr:class I SAM-dependent methyltransferase [Blastocatellia bacterium]